MRYKVMAVDDIQLNLEILEIILNEDYDVILATSGEEALKKMVDEQPDLVLLDLSMPGMDGFEVLTRMHNHHVESLTRIPVIFVTGEKDTYSEEKGLALGAVDYIRKPYIQEIIRIKIRNHIELKAYRDKLSDMVLQRTKQLEERTEQLRQSHEAVIMGMSLLSESRDQVTGAHLTRIKELTRLLAEKITQIRPDVLSKAQAEKIVAYVPLHDVGKVAIPDEILKKSGGLTPEEFDKMKVHTTGGGGLLRQTSAFLAKEYRDQLKVAIDIAENHHERYDGTGYPNRLVGDAIPLAARIASLADVYDALRSARPYKHAFTHEECMDIILNGDGRTMPAHFDPMVLEAFKEVHLAMAQAFDSNPDATTGDLL